MGETGTRTERGEEEMNGTATRRFGVVFCIQLGKDGEVGRKGARRSEGSSSASLPQYRRHRKRRRSIVDSDHALT
jgi:hypothetical protein